MRIMVLVYKGDNEKIVEPVGTYIRPIGPQFLLVRHLFLVPSIGKLR